jgi:hypothetical protein
MTFRAALVGLICVAILCVVTPYTDLVMQGSGIVANHLPIGVTFIFLVLVFFINTVLRWFGRRWAFTRAELVVILIMMLVASSIPGVGYVLLALSVPAGLQYYATPENKWETRFIEPYVPKALVPPAGNVVKWFYEGLPVHQSIPWAAWIQPILWWSSFAFLFWFAYFCLGVVLRRQWIEHERLVFPLAQVPLDIVGDDQFPSASNTFFRDKLMWVGFFLIFLIHTSNSLYLYTGLFPYFRMTGLAIGSGLTTRPWDALKGEMLYIYPSMVGIAFLISGEVAASLWFFYLLNRFQQVVIRGYGLGEPGSGSGFNSTIFFRGQEAGAFIAVSIFLFWGARKQLATTFRQSLRGQGDPGEPIPMHLAVVGFAAATLALAGWGIGFGMNWWASVIIVMLFYTVALGLTRLVSAGGITYVECSFLPQDITNNFLGTRGLGYRNLTILAFTQRIFMFNQEVTWWPYLMNSLKMGHAINLRGKHLMAAVGMAMVFAVGLSYYVAMNIIYHYGGINLEKGTMADAPTWAFNKLNSFIDSPLKPNGLGIGSTFAGMALMFFMLHMNRNFLWWRLNPLGYLMGSTGTLAHIWFSVLLGWVASSFVLKYGGLRIYRRLRPMFIGLILGEFSAAAVWLVIDYFTGMRSHNIFPNP